MRKKFMVIIAVACAACLAMFALAGCSSGSQSKSSSTGSSSTTKLIVGFDSAYPPYGFIGDDGNYTGFDLDLAQMVCDANGWEYEAMPIDWDAKDQLLNAGTITCIWNGFTLEGREGQYAFTDPYMLNAQVIVVKSGSGINSFADLAGKTVITQVDSAALEVLNEATADGGQADLTATFSGGAAQTIADYNNAFMQLDSGVVDAVACDLSIAQYQLAKNPDKYVQLSTNLSEEHYAVGFKLGNEDMAAQVTATLKDLDSQGKISELCDKYADYGISYSNWVLK